MLGVWFPAGIALSIVRPRTLTQRAREKKTHPKTTNKQTNKEPHLKIRILC